MTYAEIREKVKDGDIAFFHGTSFLAKAIQRVTQSPWNHCGLLFWEKGSDGQDDLLMLHEAVSHGCRAIRLSKKLCDCKHPVKIARHLAVDSEAKRYAIRRHSNYMLAIEYNTWALVQIYARVRFGIGRKPKFKKETICSEMVAESYSRAGVYFEASDAGFVSPADIYRDAMITEVGTVQPECEP